MAVAREIGHIPAHAREECRLTGSMSNNKEKVFHEMSTLEIYHDLLLLVYPDLKEEFLL
jgi:hypothetical protein